MTSKPVSDLQRAATRLRVAVIAAALVLVLVTAVAVLAPFPDGAAVAPRLHADGLPPAWAAAIACAVLAPVALGLGWLARMLSCVSAGEVFSVRAVAHFRRFSLCLLVAALLQLLLPAAAAVLLALQRDGGAIALSLDAGDVLAVLLAGIFYFVSRLFVEASRLDEDSRSIV
jgi:hypothetical protein